MMPLSVLLFFFLSLLLTGSFQFGLFLQVFLALGFLKVPIDNLYNHVYNNLGLS